MDDLIKIALTGTSKAGTAIAVASDCPSEQLFAEHNSTETEDTFLLRAGARAVSRQAGRIGDRFPNAIGPSPADEWPRGSARLAGLLQNAFATDSKDLLIEFLRQMRGSRLLLPCELLPQALNMSDVAVREHLLPVLGERGRWLSRFRPDWSWVLSGVATLSGSDRNALQREWDEGTNQQRCRVLRTLRQSSGDEGREWLKPAFAGEKADHRARLLATFEHGLSPADEAFLEECLDDRSKQVKEIAAGLLAQLPASDLAGRMQARADAMLTAGAKGVIRKKLKFTCEPPEQIDSSWQRDGIATKPPSGQGKRAYWTEAVLSAVSPEFWCRKFDAEPVPLIAAVGDDPFETAVLTGWTRAAVRFSRNNSDAAAWLNPLWDRWAAKAARTAGKARSAAYERLQQLIAVMPPADAEASVARLLQAARKSQETESLSLLALLPRPWSENFSREFISAARGVLKSWSDNRSYQWANTLFTAAKAIPRRTFSAALAPWDVKETKQTSGYVQFAVRETDKFCDTIRTRMSFYEEVECQLTSGSN